MCMNQSGKVYSQILWNKCLNFTPQDVDEDEDSDSSDDDDNDEDEETAPVDAAFRKEVMNALGDAGVLKQQEVWKLWSLSNLKKLYCLITLLVSDMTGLAVIWYEIKMNQRKCLLYRPLSSPPPSQWCLHTKTTLGMNFM